MNLREFFQPMREPVEKSWQVLPIFFFVMISSWVARYFTRNFLIWVITIILATAISVIVYCAIVNKLNKNKPQDLP